jgi:hypothetical protein
MPNGFLFLFNFCQVFLVTGLNRKFGISDEWFAIGDSLILTVLGQVIYIYIFLLVTFYFSAHVVKTVVLLTLAVIMKIWIHFLKHACMPLSLIWKAVVSIT